LKYSLQVAAKSIASYKGLEISYRTAIEQFMKEQVELKALFAEG
jgi:uncharacterized membrane protein